MSPSRLPSRPLHELRREARLRARLSGVPLHRALNDVAAAEGFRSWSHLVAATPAPAVALAITLRARATDLLGRLAPGSMVLLGARPGEGKTLLGLALAAQALAAGRHAAVFSLEETPASVAGRLGAVGCEGGLASRLTVDCAATIDADHIARSLGDRAGGTLAVIDYLQLLDHRRDTPPLAVQVAGLKTFARERRQTLVFLSQIDRSYDAASRPCPGFGDVRRPNPLDLSAFDTGLFLRRGEVRVRAPPT